LRAHKWGGVWEDSARCAAYSPSRGEDGEVQWHLDEVVGWWANTPCNPESVPNKSTQTTWRTPKRDYRRVPPSKRVTNGRSKPLCTPSSSQKVCKIRAAASPPPHKHATPERTHHVRSNAVHGVKGCAALAPSWQVHQAAARPGCPSLTRASRATTASNTPAPAR
jgi:hypothetical protein